MGFYQDISFYYDSIFPFKQNTFHFLLDCYESVNEKKECKGKILDVACGSGNYAITFAGYCLEVTGNDLDQFMINQAITKNRYNNVSFSSLNMLEIDKSNIAKGSLDFAYCIGNSIVHLDNTKEMESFIQKVYQLLSDGGCFVVQIVNYDRILSQGITSLPTIENQEDGVVFIRDYIHHIDKIEFKTTLIIDSDHMEEEYRQSVMLYPLKSKNLKSLFVNNGFTKIEMFGNFNKEPYSEDISYGLIIKGYKELAV